MRAFQRASEAHGDPVAALRALRDHPDAFADPALASTQGYVAVDPERWIGQPLVGSGQCVALVQQTTGAPLTAQWRRVPRLPIQGHGTDQDNLHTARCEILPIRRVIGCTKCLLPMKIMPGPLRNQT